MNVTVTYNKKSYDHFFRPIFIEHPHLEQSLLDDFKRYKETNTLPDYFGRDTNYLRPCDIEHKKLMHIHLALHGKKLKTPDGGDIDVKTSQWNRTSDSALIYSQNIFDDSHYSLIALFDPGAHLKAQNYPRMRILASYGEEFRKLII
jgi:mRNA interferase YafO